MRITLNGEAREVEPGTTVAALVEGLGFSAAQVAVERNRELVPRARHAETRLEDADVVELVTLVGGG